ncbi:MAG: ABC transporter substrate-binding protein [Rhodospirillales bacterium]|nr:ABC transporter substrate-binding protein [Rhodospirillales bacterium]
MMKTFISGAGALALIAAAGPAEAGKKDNTLTVALQEAFAHVNPILAPGAEMQVIVREIFDTLMTFDRDSGKLLPSLAESWKRVDPKTWEFKLRKGVLWSDGEPFTAKDVAHTVNYASDPKVKLRLKPRFSWVKTAEVIDDHTVRLVTKRPYAPTLRRLAVTWPMFPEHAHGPYKNKADFGRKPVGTGPYRAVQVDKNKGIVLVRNERYRHTNKVRPAPSIDRVVFKIIPDQQTQVASLITGEIDVTRVFSKDLADQLAKNPKLQATAVNSFRYHYMSLDAADRSGIKALADIRVRRAIAHAINIPEMRKEVLAGGDRVLPMNAPCLSDQFGCDVTTAPPAYDPAKAKALLKEAGWEQGFDMELTSLGESVTVNEAIIGYLRHVGIRATLKRVPINTLRKVRAQGKLNSLVGIYGSGGIPDADPVLSFFWAGKGKPRDYYYDDVITKLGAQSRSQFNETKRLALTRQAFDRNNEQVYIIPFGSAPTVLVHSKDLNVPRDFSTNAYGLPLSTVSWKK